MHGRRRDSTTFFFCKLGTGNVGELCVAPYWVCWASTRCGTVLGVAPKRMHCNAIEIVMFVGSDFPGSLEHHVLLYVEVLSV